MAGGCEFHKVSGLQLEIYILALSRQITKYVANQESLHFRGGEQWFLKVLISNSRTSVDSLLPGRPVGLPSGSQAPATVQGVSVTRSWWWLT